MYTEWNMCNMHVAKSEAGMEWGQIGVFTWQLALAILPASAWLIICRLIPGLRRRRVGTSYCIAAVIVIMSCVFSRHGFSLAGLLAASFACVLLSVLWRKALKHRSMEINTIISYDDHGQI
jgi:hypothetical protein